MNPISLSTFALLFFFMSCSKDDFKKVYTLNDLRVIAVTSGKQGTPLQAEYDPNDTVVLTPYVSDYPYGRTVTATVESCRDPGVAYGEKPTCVGAIDRNTNYAPIVFDTSTLAAHTGAMPSINVNVPSNVLSGHTSVDQYNGVNYLVTFSFSISGKAPVTAFKRLVVTTRTQKNQNPTLGTITFPTTTSIALSSSSSEENYSLISNNGIVDNLTEKMSVAWYVNEGDLESPVTDRTIPAVYTPPAVRSSPQVVAAVIRDGRGGMAVQVSTIP